MTTVSGSRWRIAVKGFRVPTYFEDFKIGEAGRSSGYKVTRGEIVHGDLLNPDGIVKHEK